MQIMTKPFFRTLNHRLDALHRFLVERIYLFPELLPVAIDYLGNARVIHVDPLSPMRARIDKQLAAICGV